MSFLARLEGAAREEEEEEEAADLLVGTREGMMNI